jgi:hypothetical protein
MTDEIEYTCCVCGARLPHLPKEQMISLGCAIKRNEEQYIYFCIHRHTEEEVAAAITGMPKFKRASELKEGIC